jgi:phasin family protein
MQHKPLDFIFFASTLYFVAVHNTCAAVECHHKENRMFPINEQVANAVRNMFPANEQYLNGMKNMLPNNEQFANAFKARLETQITTLAAFTGKGFESMEKLVELNLDTGKAALEDYASAAKQLLSAKDPQEVLSLSVAQVQPAAAKAIAYNRQLAVIAAATQAEFARAREEQIADTSRKISAFFDETCKGAPTGSENAIAIMKSAIGNANAGYEQFNKTSKQAVEVMKSNLNMVANQVTQTASANDRSRPSKH